MKVLLALCIMGLSAEAACAKAPVEQLSCFERCKQDMKACYRINDVIYIDHCDGEYKRCSAACGYQKRD